ncbi:MAG: hypothetical protein WA461_11360 [Nitrososphaeraceae archaeon]
MYLRPLGFRCHGDCGGLDYGSIVLSSVKYKDKSRDENAKTTKRRTIISKRNSGMDRTAASPSKTVLQCHRDPAHYKI